MRAGGDGDFDDGQARASQRRAQAFAAAARHSSRVKVLRRTMIGGASFACIALLGYTFLRPGEIAGAHLSLEKLGLSGDRITMDHPKLTGVRRDGRPYVVTAASGVQHPREPSRMELVALDARMHLSGDAETRVLGDKGLYDSNAQSLALSGHVSIASGDYLLTLQSADMNFKTSEMDSREASQLTFPGGWIHADAMNMSDNGAQITFSGNVQSQFQQTGNAAPGPEGQ